MKVLNTLVFFFALVTIVLGWTSQEYVKVQSNACVSSDPLVGKLPVGESRLKDSCVRATCSPGHIELAGCGVAFTTHPCYMGEEDLRKPYPACCPQAICPQIVEN